MEPNTSCINGGDGAYTCTKYAEYQKTLQDCMKKMIGESIAEKFDMRSLISSTNTVRIADLGCSVGPNTFITVQNVVEAMERKLRSQMDPNGKIVPCPEFHVFFSDLSSNDFNTLFTSFPPDRRYFAAGVPGSFYGRLFPKSSLHFVLSCCTLMYLSKVPEGLLDINSPAWNKGTISYSNASKQVADAYAAQFAADMGGFLNARADEIAVGGMMMIMTPTTALDGAHGSQHQGRLSLLCLEQSLMDMVKMGIITEAQVDSFNLPFYEASPDEMSKLIERNGCFDIERMELVALSSKNDPPPSLEALTMDFRSGLEGPLTAHFGTRVTDQVFERTFNKVAEVYSEIASNYKRTTVLFLVLKRR